LHATYESFLSKVAFKSDFLENFQMRHRLYMLTILSFC